MQHQSEHDRDHRHELRASRGTQTSQAYGQDLRLLGMAVVWEEISRTIALPPRGPGVFGPDVKPVLFTLNPAQKEKYLFPVLRGEKTTAFAQSEPDAGSDPGAMRTTAVRKG